MKLGKSDLIYFILLVIISVFTVFDLFVNIGKSATMDGLAHITTIAQFYKALADGNFPVIWVDGFANYGLPLGIFAHQLPAYIGAFFNLVTHDAVLSFNLVTFVAVFLSAVFFYIFLRIYFSPLLAFTATILFNLAPYRIINLYIRGAVPETFSAIFLPLVLISIYALLRKKNWAYFSLTASLTLLILTHPMMFIAYSFIFVPFFFFTLLCKNGRLELVNCLAKKNLILTVLFGSAIFFALALSAYYIIPLNIEIKYFFYGRDKNHLTPGQFLNLINYLNPGWYYFYKNDILTRGHFIQAGLVETVGLFIGLTMILEKILKERRRNKFTLLEFSIMISLIIIFFTTKFSDFFYKNINYLSNIQFPWRLFSALIFLPPIIFIYILKRINNAYLVVLFIFFIFLIRFPQLYGKNYILFPQTQYYFTPTNLHSVNMNTIWTGKTDEYPVKSKKPEIIEGKGKILVSEVHNSWRKYEIEAENKLRLVDYTFYFPGWAAYVDGKKTEIEFQDMNYRGIITYFVPKGKHTVFLKFEDTKVRLFAKIISAISIVIFIISLFIELKYRPIYRLSN